MRRALTDRKWLWLIAIVTLFAILTSRTGTDANWDLRNYHAYSAHALLSGRFWTDIAAAQLQTFFSPVLDIAIGALRDWLNDAPVLLNIVLSMQHALAVWLAFLLTMRVIPAGMPGRGVLAIAASLFGAAGAAGYPLLASSQSDMLPGSCILGGLLLLIDETRRPIRNAAFAGLLFGVAAGLKLTALPYCVAAAVALLVAPHHSAISRAQQMAAFLLTGVLAIALLAGPWWAVLVYRYRNPVLPFMNQWFHSPFVDPIPYTEERFKPRSLLQALAYPFFWAFQPTTYVSELPVRDPRFALAYVALLAVVVRQVLNRRSDRCGTFLSVFAASAFALWELAFSNLRYLATLELLAGTMVLLALRPLLEKPTIRIVTAAGFIALAIAVQAVTLYPDWGRTPAPTPVRVTMPTMEPGSLVILLDQSAMAYLANLVPPAIPFVGTNNNLILLGDRGRLARQAETMVRSHTGPLYGVENPIENPGVADQTLAYYELRRSHCTQVESNLDNDAIRLCRLQADNY